MRGRGPSLKAGTVTPVPGSSRRPALAAALAVALAAGAAWLPATGHAQHTKLSLESIGPDGGNGAQSAELVGALGVGKRSFIRTAEPLVSSDTDSSLDVYERTGSGTTLVSTGPTGGNGAFPVNFGAAVEAGQAVVFQTEEQLTAADTDDSLDVYRRAAGATTLVSTGPDGWQRRRWTRIWPRRTRGARTSSSPHARRWSPPTPTHRSTSTSARAGRPRSSRPAPAAATATRASS